MSPPQPHAELRRRHLTLADALAALGQDAMFAEVLAHGTLSVEIYAPRGVDPQTPHRRDELYVVVSGRGEFLNGKERHPFGPGDVIFVPAGVVHRFENFTDDFVTWVVFYGPDGGEQDAPV
jgi:mannose-6-phosphate isomerase-like protein (cupin superfamily)